VEAHIVSFEIDLLFLLIFVAPCFAFISVLTPLVTE